MVEDPACLVGWLQYEMYVIRIMVNSVNIPMPNRYLCKRSDKDNSYLLASANLYHESAPYSAQPFSASIPPNDHWDRR